MCLVPGGVAPFTPCVSLAEHSRSGQWISQSEGAGPGHPGSDRTCFWFPRSPPLPHSMSDTKLYKIKLSDWHYNNTVLCICTCVTTFLCLLVYTEDPAGAPALPGSQGQLNWLRPHPYPGQWAEGKQERDPDQQLQVHLQPSGLFLHQGGAGEGFPLPTGNNLSLSEHWWHSKDIENRIYISQLSSPKITYIWKRSYKRRKTIIIRSHCHPN